MSAAVVPIRYPLEVIEPSTAPAVEVSDGHGKWRFGPGISGRNHFWSTNGIECLWCAQQRSPAEIEAWFDAGKPEEVCR